MYIIPGTYKYRVINYRSWKREKVFTFCFLIIFLRSIMNKTSILSPSNLRDVHKLRTQFRGRLGVENLEKSFKIPWFLTYWGCSFLPRVTVQSSMFLVNSAPANSPPKHQHLYLIIFLKFFHPSHIFLINAAKLPIS